MVNLETLYKDMRGILHWSNPVLYSKHYHLPDAGEIGAKLAKDNSKENQDGENEWLNKD